MDHSNAKIPPPRRKKKGPAKKAPKASNLTNRLDALVRRVVRARDLRCVTCGSQEVLEVSHYLGRASLGVRWDLRNCNLQCHVCHRKFHEGNPAYMRYMASQYGEDIFEELYLQQAEWMKKGGASVVNKMAIYDDLTKAMKELTSC